MRPRETGGSSNPNSDASKKSMEKTTQSSQQSAPDYVKLSHRSTPENPGLYGGMKPNDRASTSDGSRSQHDERMLDLMQMTMREKLDVAHKLEQAKQENGKLQKNIQDLTNRLKQANRDKQDLDNQLKQARRENEKLANQLKEARLGGTSSLQEGESSSQSIKEKELAREAMRKWFAEKLKR